MKASLRFDNVYLKKTKFILSWKPYYLNDIDVDTKNGAIY